MLSLRCSVCDEKESSVAPWNFSLSRGVILIRNVNLIKQQISANLNYHDNRFAASSYTILVIIA